MTIHKARNGDVEIAYEVEGPPDGVPLLLAWAGAGTQMIMWPPRLRAGLIERGFRVATMEPRDVGLSTWLNQHNGVKRRRGEVAYTLRDMTDDVVAVLDALEWPSAVVVGASLGGALAQATACHHPDRVSGLISLMSTPSPSLWLNRPRIGTTLKMIKVMSGTSPDRDAEGQRWVDLFRVFASPGYPSDDEHWREAGRVAFDRGLNPAGVMRQFAAVRAAGDRRPELTALRIPTLVVHGKIDRMSSWRGGKATADAIAGAELLLLPGVNHQLPEKIWPMLLDRIEALFARTGATGVR